MSKISKEQFLADVMHEINMLKQHATQEEISRLDISTFDHTRVVECIYGQMTHSCMSSRAKELMDLACVRVLDVKVGVDSIDGCDIESSEFNINGEYSGQTWASIGRNFSYLSALEGYICTKNANIEGIIQYLKGEIDTLEL